MVSSTGAFNTFVRKSVTAIKLYIIEFQLSIFYFIPEIYHGEKDHIVSAILCIF